MKLQISFNMTDLDKALALASQIDQYADSLEIGTLLIYAHGTKALQHFKDMFPDKTLLADAKIVHSGKESTGLFAKAGADWITIMAGTRKNIIHTACTTAHDLNKKVMLDLLDTSSVAQSALEAKNLGADALLFQDHYDEKEPHIFVDKWEMIRGNTDLPIFISTNIKPENIEQIINLKPDGLIIGSPITEAEDPVTQAQLFHDIIAKNP